MSKIAKFKTLVPMALLLLALLLAGPSPTFAAGAEWTLEKDEDHIQLYTREVAGSPFLAVKVIALINAPIEKVAAAFGDGNGCAEWRAMCKSSQVLSEVSDQESFVYLVLDLPWPVSDRDLVMHSTTQIDPESKTATVVLESASDRHPPQDFVRAEASGQYTIRAVNEKLVEFTYIMHIDLGGDLSPNMINSRLTSSTFKDIKRLLSLVES